MTRKKIKKTLLITTAVFLFLVAVLGVHIYMVTRPKADEHTIAMARIDIKQKINQDDANKITQWLYQQKGVGHVLCNPVSDIVVFTYYPIQVNANEIVSKFKSSLNYKSERFMPSQESLQSGCPAMAGSMAGKVSIFFKKIFN